MAEFTKIKRAATVGQPAHDRVPRADDLPSFRVSQQNTPCPGNPLGMKGCGEAGAIGSPPAVINAITDAIGNNNLSMPATPQTVWKALQG